MKKLSILRAIVALALAATLMGFTWEGELDPNDFDEWEVLSVQPTPQGLAWMYVRNPDPASPIKIVALAADKSSYLYGYRYFKYDVPYSYTFNTEQDKYVQRHLTDKQIRACMKCHSDKLVPKAAI